MLQFFSFKDQIYRPISGHLCRSIQFCDSYFIAAERKLIGQSALAPIVEQCGAKRYILERTITVFVTPHYNCVSSQIYKSSQHDAFHIPFRHWNVYGHSYAGTYNGNLSLDNELIFNFYHFIPHLPSPSDTLITHYSRRISLTPILPMPSPSTPRTPCAAKLGCISWGDLIGPIIISRIAWKIGGTGLVSALPTLPVIRLPVSYSPPRCHRRLTISVN